MIVFFVGVCGFARWWNVF